MCVCLCMCVCGLKYTIISFQAIFNILIFILHLYYCAMVQRCSEIILYSFFCSFIFVFFYSSLSNHCVSSELLFNSQNNNGGVLVLQFAYLLFRCVNVLILVSVCIVIAQVVCLLLFYFQHRNRFFDYFTRIVRFCISSFVLSCCRRTRSFYFFITLWVGGWVCVKMEKINFPFRIYGNRKIKRKRFRMDFILFLIHRMRVCSIEWCGCKRRKCKSAFLKILCVYVLVYTWFGTFEFNNKKKRTHTQR